MGPEVRVQTLFRDRFIGVVRKGHALSKGKLTPARYAMSGHISVSRRGLDQGPIVPRAQAPPRSLSERWSPSPY